VTRQSFVLATSDNEVVAEPQAPVVTYDPIARTVTLRGQRQPWLQPGRLYRLFVRAVGDSEVGGLRAVDGATLATGQRRRIEFFAGPPGSAPFAEARVDFCVDVLPIFQAKCGSGGCHGEGGGAAAGLVLATPEGVASTAIGRVAHGADTTGRSGSLESEGPVFGVGMPLVAPGSPGSSWLLYKVEAAPEPARARAAEAPLACASPEGITPPAAAPAFLPQLGVPVAATPAERTRLRDLVTGQPMPYPTLEQETYATAPLTFAERETLRLWISQLPAGAPLPACGACASVP
jgi:hypothetical protein